MPAAIIRIRHRNLKPVRCPEIKGHHRKISDLLTGTFIIMSQTDIIKSTGRRKTAVARVHMKPGTGQITINQEPMEDVFPTLALQNSLIQPLQIANQPKSWDLNVITNGGGVTGQVGAVRLAIARALLKDNPELRAIFREEGLLTRDARKKERKKAGQPGARKRFQFSKR